MKLTRSVFWLLPLAALALPLFVNPYYQYVVNLILVYVLVGVGFNIVVGNLGQLAFSNVAFFGIGAYASAIFTTQLGIPWWLTIIPARSGQRGRGLRREHSGPAGGAALLPRDHDPRVRGADALVPTSGPRPSPAAPWG